ncbi:MAG TPA: substrate-binding domain-containing protein [bacterium]|nr:substrate-binding domain-containing protein [bacterium]
MIFTKRGGLTICLVGIVFFATALSACTPGGGGSTSQSPVTRILTEEELNYFNGNEFFNGEYLNIRNQFLGSLYEAPEKVDLFQLFYVGSGEEELLTPAERAAVIAANGWEQEPDCACTKISGHTMDAILQQHSGIALADSKGIGLEQFTYLEEYDAYYHYHGDTNYRQGISFFAGERQEDLVRLFYEDTYSGAGEKILTLREKGDSYLFVSNTTLAFETGSPKNALSDAAANFGITAKNYPKIDGSSSTLPIARAINRAFYREEENDNFPTEASKTVPSYKLLLEGEVDLILVPYASREVLDLAQEKGLELEFHPIAAEALVFITPTENPAENISLDQVLSIYLDYGITNWQHLNGPDRELVPICRNADSGSQSQLDNLVLGDKKMHWAIKKNYVELTMEGMLEQVAFYHNGGLSGEPTNSYALGYTLYTYLKGMGELTGIDEELKLLAVNGVTPTEKTIAAGSYPLTTAYYAVIRSDLAADHSARGIIDWLTSDHGQAAIRQLKLIPNNRE